MKETSFSLEQLYTAKGYALDQYKVTKAYLRTLRHTRKSPERAHDRHEARRNMKHWKALITALSEMIQRKKS